MIWGGFFIPFLGGLGMFIFSVCLFFNVSLVIVWLYLELSGLCLIPLFFSGGSFSTFSSLFYYIVFSGLSSGLLLMGILVPECFFFLIVGFLVKFGIFPLWGWVYRVCCASSWCAIWGFSTLLKVSLLLFPMFLVLSPLTVSPVIILCGAGCIFLSWLFWFYSFDWKFCWTHVMLSSSSVLFGLGASGCFLGELFSVYFVYLIWASLVIFYLFWYSGKIDFPQGGVCVFLFIFLLLNLPISISIFYKILVCSCIFSSGFFLFFSWVFYSFSEQVYFFLFLTGLYNGKGDSGLFAFV